VGVLVTSVWYQAEFYSVLSQCWVALYPKHVTEESALEALRGIAQGRRRVVKITQTKETIKEAATEAS
jgi:hypothetical protein